MVSFKRENFGKIKAMRINYQHIYIEIIKGSSSAGREMVQDGIVKMQEG